MTFDEIAYESRGPVRVIRFNRPEVRNCIGPRTHRELIAAWSDFRDDAAAKVAIITGTGDKAFCAGGDLKAGEGIMPLDADEIAAHNRGERPGVLGPSRWTDIYKPIIAAVNGVAYAGGLEWACFADIRIAEEHASFGVTCRRWNIGLADGGTQRLPRIVGMGRAMELIITGRVIDAREAERIGLVNEVVPAAEVLERGRWWAARLAAGAPLAVRATKAAVNAQVKRTLIESFDLATALELSTFQSEDHQEALAALRERRPPEFKGR